MGVQNLFPPTIDDERKTGKGSKGNGGFLISEKRFLSHRNHGFLNQIPAFQTILGKWRADQGRVNLAGGQLIQQLIGIALIDAKEYAGMILAETGDAFNNGTGLNRGNHS